jgi:hypothetical protein
VLLVAARVLVVIVDVTIVVKLDTETGVLRWQP